MPYFVYVSVGGEDRVNVFSMDPETGKLDTHAVIAVGNGPGPLCVDPNQRFLYAGLRGGRQLAAFRLDRGSGRLAPLGTSPLEADPTFISTDRTGRYLLSAYYRAGMASVHSLRRDGSVGTPALFSVKTTDRAHSIQTDISNNFAYVPHTAGPNLIYQYRFDEKTGRLSSNPAGARLEPPEGEGPRHFCFHPAMDIAYFVNEQSSSITAYNVNTQDGTLTRFQNVSSLPHGFEGENTCAEIRITPTGEYVYASNRGHDSIAAFTVDGSTGALEPLSHTPTEPTPRAFALDPDGAYLIAAGQGSGRLAAYRVDDETGHLEPLETYDVGTNPVCVLVLDLGQS
ncbi:MAG: lactonase family protein [Candidatus Latescibacterota bacterium]|nr:lactonase family protein [Candidatus Latescibacterota bacterium]